MAAESGKDFASRLALIQKRLKEERLFVRQERDLIRTLNENLSKESQNLFHLSWCTQQHWKNLDRLVLGSRVFPSECSKTSKSIDCVTFEDGSKCLGYQEMKYGEFLQKLRESSKLVARVLICADNMKIDTALIVRLMLSSIFGSCVFKEEEKSVLTMLKVLVEEQVITCDDPLAFFCNPKSNAFSVVLKLFTNLLFSAKLYQTAALHGGVMQVIVEDNFYLDLEVNKMLSRFPPKSIRQKFGEPATGKATKKIGEFMESLLNYLVSLCKKFLRGLVEKLYCFPPNLRWLIKQLFQSLMSRSDADERKVKAIIGHLLINYFVCPAILNPEPYGINTDATVTEIARYNLSQVASVLSALALEGCGLKDPKMTKILDKLEPGIITSYVDAILKESHDLNPLEEIEPIHGIHRSAILITERELKYLIFFLKQIQLQQNPLVMEAGLNEVLELLPALPRRWTKPKSQQRLVQSLPPLPLDPQSSSPLATLKQKRLTIGKKYNSLYSQTKDTISAGEASPNKGKVEEDSTDAAEDDLEHLLKGLGSVLSDDEKVLVITLGNVTGDEPGMLSEEKVLGLKYAVPTAATFDIDRTEEDRRKRASTLMLDALKDLSDGFIGSQEDMEKVKSIVGQIDEQTSEESDPITSSYEKSLDEESLPANSVVNGDLLIAFGSSDASSLGTSVDSSRTEPLKPTKTDAWGIAISDKNANQQNPFESIDSKPFALDRTDNSNFAKQTGDSRSTDSPFMDNFCVPLAQTVNSGNSNNSDALNDLMDFGFSETGKNGHISDSPTSLDRSLSNTSQSSSTTYNGNKRLSQVSLESVLGGINTVLKGAGIPESSNLQENNITDIPELAEGTGDIHNNDVIGRERTITADSITSSEFSLGPWNEATSTGTKGTEEQEEYRTQNVATDDLKEMFLETETIGRSATDVSDVNSRRKKSSGLRFKDKIVSGFRQARSKSDGHHLKKEGKRFQPKQVNILLEKEEKIIPEDDIIPDQNVSTVGKTAKDISEDILQKYRRLAPKTAGLMEDDDSFQSSDGETGDFVETAWDDNFKFEDAKRKLRIVLCMADRSHFPCGSTDCSKLLMTFLLSQLAEAINLQDRSFVAQLHETLRSIRLLPADSCAQLLDALEGDYKDRSPYIAYLIRSKQHLLAALSHLEQLSKKVERDKNICSKYFTTVCVRLFLETPEKRRELQAFAAKFEATNMLDEKCALVEEFLDHLFNEMTKDPTWLSASDEQWIDCQVATERSLMSSIYKDAFYPNGETDIQNDRIFHEHICRLTKFVTVNHKSLQIPKVYQKEAPWPSAQTELLMINAYKTPVDKLRCIHRCCVTIMNLLSMASDDSAPGADDFVPVLVYVVIRANPPHLLSTKQYVNNFYETRLSGEEYYCWMQFCAAVEFIKSLDNR